MRSSRRRRHSACQGKRAKAKGGDFINEGRNKDRKKLLLSKFPKEADWTCVERALNKVKAIHKKTLDVCNLDRTEKSDPFDPFIISEHWCGG